MSEPVIPEAAVYAAAEAVYGCGLDGSPVKDARLADFRKALEAAAPHMLNNSWGEGYGAGWNDCLLDLQNDGAKMTANPYRPTP